jgi:hypothetical protein
VWEKFCSFLLLACVDAEAIWQHKDDNVYLATVNK